MSRLEELKKDLKKIRGMVEELKTKAKAQKLPNKIQTVAEVFGKRSDWGGGQYLFSEKDLSITYSTSSQNYVRVDLGYGSEDVFAGELRYNQDPRIDLYIQGDWEKRIDELYRKVPENQKSREIKSLEGTIERLSSKWQIPQ